MDLDDDAKTDWKLNPGPFTLETSKLTYYTNRPAKVYVDICETLIDAYWQVLQNKNVDSDTGKSFKNFFNFHVRILHKSIDIQYVW